MDGANEVIPRMPVRQTPNPLLLSGEVIHFQSQLDRERGKFALSFSDFVHVLIQLIEAHSPIIKVVSAHRRMI